MLQALLRCYPIGVVEFEHLLQQVESFIRYTTLRSDCSWIQMLSQTTSSYPRWKFYSFWLSKPITFRPLWVGRCTQNCNDPCKLVSLGSSWENGSSKIHFSHDAAECENVDTFCVLCRPEHKFWSPVPPSWHILRMVACLLDIFGQSEVCELQYFFWCVRVTVGCNKEVLRLHVSMHIPVLVHIGNGSNCLEHHGLDLAFLKFGPLPRPILHLLVQIVIAVLKNNIYFIIFLIVDHFLYFDEEGRRIQFLQSLNFWHFETLLPTGVMSFHFLNCDYFLGLSVKAL